MIRRSTCLPRMVHSLRLCFKTDRIFGSLPAGANRWFASEAASPLQEEEQRESAVRSGYGETEYAELDWDNLGFGLIPTDYMYVMKCGKDGDFRKGSISPFGNIEISPSAGVLNYGQGVYEGTKAYRKEDGNILLFRPDQNAIRMKYGADRMCMPSPSVHQFLDAVKQTALANKRWIPPPGKGSLYIRPLLIGSGSVLGLGPAPEFTFMIYASPVGNYFKDGTAPLNLYVEEEYARACPGGSGGVKSITNYAPVMKALNRAKTRGFSDALYLDAKNKKYLEEASSCNVFIVKGRKISTPAAVGTILKGITRKSIMELASDRGYEVEERAVPVEDLLDADEAFCTGTAVGVAPVGTVTYRDQRIEYKSGSDTICKQLYSDLVGIQTGRIEDNKGWVIEMS